MALRAKDLMIGDWVHIKSSTYGELNSQVFTIEGDDDWKGVWVKDKKCYGRINESEIEPIPLTTEILEKNGFGYTEESEYYTHYYLGEKNFCKMGLHIGTDKMGNYWLNTIRDTIYGLNAVHQLQHALRMCGIEKEIII